MHFLFKCAFKMFLGLSVLRNNHVKRCKNNIEVIHENQSVKGLEIFLNLLEAKDIVIKIKNDIILPENVKENFIILNHKIT